MWKPNNNNKRPWEENGLQEKSAVWILLSKRWLIHQINCSAMVHANRPSIILPKSVRSMCSAEWLWHWPLKRKHLRAAVTYADFIPPMISKYMRFFSSLWTESMYNPQEMLAPVLGVNLTLLHWPRFCKCRMLLCYVVSVLIQPSPPDRLVTINNLNDRASACLNFNVSFVQGVRTPKKPKEKQGNIWYKMYVSLQQETIRLKKPQTESMCLTI